MSEHETTPECDQSVNGSMRYFVNVSGGSASAVAADRALARYGHDAVDLWFADTSWEDEDLYRFLDDLERHWGKAINRHRDGRTPLQVAAQRKIIPNHRIAPCSYELKVKPLAAIQMAATKPLTVLMGLDWKEMHRIEKVRERHSVPDVALDFPLLWKPLEMRPYAEVIRSWGLEPPRAYRLGLTHNNCGGRCVRQGIREWRKLRVVWPERFAEMRDWEEAQRAKGGARGSAAFVTERSGGERTPITLAELEKDMQDALPLFDDAGEDDRDSCLCPVI